MQERAHRLGSQRSYENARTAVNVDDGDEEAAQVKRGNIVERIAKQAWRQKTKRKK